MEVNFLVKNTDLKSIHNMAMSSFFEFFPLLAHEQRVMEILTELQRQSADLLQEVKFIGGRLKKLEESPVDRYSRHLYPREEYAMCALDEIVTLLELPLTTMEMFENSEKTLKESSETRFALVGFFLFSSPSFRFCF